jgi:hypothetical protein
MLQVILIVLEEEQDLPEFEDVFNLEKRISDLEVLFNYLKKKRNKQWFVL